MRDQLLVNRWNQWYFAVGGVRGLQPGFDPSLLRFFLAEHPRSPARISPLLQNDFQNWPSAANVFEYAVSSYEARPAALRGMTRPRLSL